MQAWFRFLFFIMLLFIGAKGYSQPVITTDTVIQTSLCAGSNVIIPFTVIDTGGFFNFGNIFTAQLSDNFGVFSNPVDIGVLPIPWTTSGVVLGTIPASSPLFGIYKVRVVGSNPVVTGSESLNYVLILNTAILATITSPDSIICEGDSTVLTATPFFQSYQWERNGNSIAGATAQTFTATQDGSYAVTVIDTLGCETNSEPFNVYVDTCTGMIYSGLGSQRFSLFPNPVLEFLTIMSDARSFSDAFLSIYNTMGQAILVMEIQNGTRELMINTTGMPPGFYAVKLNSTTSNGVGVTRFIKL